MPDDGLRICGDNFGDLNSIDGSGLQSVRLVVVARDGAIPGDTPDIPRGLRSSTGASFGKPLEKLSKTYAISARR